MENPEEFELRVRPRPAETVSIKIPVDTLAAIRKVAAKRDMSEESLLKLYIGHGLRQDLARLFSDHLLETTAQVLSRHLESEEEVSAIIEEIRGETTPQV